MLYHHAKRSYLFIACGLVAVAGGCEAGGAHAGLGTLIALLAMAFPRGRPPTSLAVVTRSGLHQIARRLSRLHAAGLLQLLAD